MQLYIDDALFAQGPNVKDLESALVRFRALGGKRFELRRAPSSRLTISRFESELFLEVETEGRLDGVILDGWETAVCAARDYWIGLPARVTPPSPKTLPPGAQHVLVGDPDPNCAFCRAWGLA